MSKIKQEEKWEIEDNINILMKYQQLIKDKEKKQKAIDELKRRRENIDKIINSKDTK